ncbi:MAG: 50S ribosomal protein L23 [Acidobacteria bacterium]|nr:50S ribosomal protein L23 [Acidobacteriota bacterium]
MTKIFDVIRRPLLTEKSQILREQTDKDGQPRNLQVFEVAVWASKHQIKEAAELLLQTKVKSVRTVRIPAKQKRLGRWIGTTGTTKKAYVELAGTPATEQP